MKLKIGILGCRGIPNAYGGFEQFAEQLAVALAGRGHEVFVYNSSLHPYKKNKWQDVHIIHCSDWEDKLDAAGQFIYDWNCIRDSRKRNFDVLLQLGYTSNSVWHWLWPKNAIHIVNMDGLEWKRTQYSKAVRQFIKKAERWAAAHADYMVADSPAIQQYLSDTYQRTPIFIPYAAEPFTQPDASRLNDFQLHPHNYYLMVSRMEPENNVEMIIEGYLDSKKDRELVIVGGINKFGKRWKKRYADPKIKFTGAVFDKNLLNNLRYFSRLHFHGHSVGGTNPSLLEAMACQCTIAAHDNIFNRSVLQTEGEYFSNAGQVTAILNSAPYPADAVVRLEKNLDKIQTLYSPEKMVNAYESLMLNAVQSRTNAPAAVTHQIA